MTFIRLLRWCFQNSKVKLVRDKLRRIEWNHYPPFFYFKSAIKVRCGSIETPLAFHSDYVAVPNFVRLWSRLHQTNPDSRLWFTFFPKGIKANTAHNIISGWVQYSTWWARHWPLVYLVLTMRLWLFRYINNCQRRSPYNWKKAPIGVPFIRKLVPQGGFCSKNINFSRCSLCYAVFSLACFLLMCFW